MGSRYLRAFTTTLSAVALMAASLVPVRSEAGVLGGHVSAESVDCLWVSAPDSFKQAVSASATPNAALGAIKGWGPSNAELTALAKKCGVAGGSVRVPGEVATLAIAGKVLEVWGVERLSEAHQFTEADLSRGWAAVTPAGRNALARRWLSMGKEQEPEDVKLTIHALLASLNPPNQQAAIAIGYYAYGRAILEDLGANGSSSTPPLAQSDATTLESLRTSAEGGDGVAEYKLGAKYNLGDGLEADQLKAFFWTKRSAEHGYILGWLALGMMYGMGQGTQKDYVEAYKWFELAATLTPSDWPPEVRQDAIADRAAMAKNMTPSQVADAKSRAHAWWDQIVAARQRPKG